MIEIISIICQLFVFLIIFSFPFTPKILNNYFSSTYYKFKLIDAHSINIIFFIYICLIFSFANLDLEIFFRTYLILSILYIIVSYKNYRLILKTTEKFLFFFFLLISISIFLYIGQNLKLEWDGANHWLEKVLIFFNDEQIKNLKDVKIHSHYPHLGSYIWALFWKNSLLEFEYMGRLFQVYFYIISIFLIVDTFKTKNYLNQILLILFFIIITFDSYLFAGYQEYLIFSTLIIASKYISLIDFKKTQDFKIIFLILLTLYLNCWFKDEGIVYFFLFSFLLILVINTSLISKFLLIFFIISLFLLQYILQKYLIGIYDFPQKISFSNLYNDLTNLQILFSKIFKIITHIFISFIKYPLWIIIFIVIFIKLFSNLKINIHEKYIFLCLIFNLGFLISIFFTFRSFDFMLKVSLDRLLFQTSGFYLILTLVALNNLNILKK